MPKIKCGNCGQYHASISDVKLCHVNGLAPVQQELPIAPVQPPTIKQLRCIKEVRKSHRVDDENLRTMEPKSKEEASWLIRRLLQTPVQQKGTMIRGVIPEQGRFTVVWPDGDWRTFRINTPSTGKFAGIRMVSILAGPDNGLDYQRVGQVTKDGSAIRVWERYRQDSKVVEGLTFLVESMESQMKAGEMYAVRSSNCWRCGHTLTVPASVSRGLGPDCAEILGVA